MDLLRTRMFCTFFLLLGSTLQALSQASEIPEDFFLLFEEDFDSGTHLNRFEMTDPSAWRIGEDAGNACLELFGKSDYQPRVRSPFNIAMIRHQQFGDFTLEVKLKQTGREYGHRDMCLFFNMKDPANFYYVHIASIADPHAHNIFLVNDEPRVAIAQKTTEGADWTQGWHTIRIERRVDSGAIRVYFDDMSQPIMVAEDTHFPRGHIGLGSFDDTGMIDNIKIWGPSPSETSSGNFFNP